MSSQVNVKALSRNFNVSLPSGFYICAVGVFFLQNISLAVNIDVINRYLLYIIIYKYVIGRYLSGVLCVCIKG